MDAQGSDVTNLQAYLIANGYLAAGNATGYFGPLTAQAVGKLQVALGLVSSASDSAYGILGPKTRAAIACTPQQPTTETPAPTQNPAPSNYLIAATSSALTDSDPSTKNNPNPMSASSSKKTTKPANKKPSSSRATSKKPHTRKKNYKKIASTH
jgi:peptidoglycan hydrolase-like protein with peptidoglycan-binding domain